MKNEAQYAKPIATLLKKIRTAKVTPPAARDSITQMVLGFLEWNATRDQAEAAHQRLMAELVDCNDLRVSLTDDVVVLLGTDYPDAEVRCIRMQESLQEVFIREYEVSLEVLSGKPKKVVRQYLDTLPGMPGYVAAQVTLLNFAGHAIPVDDRMAALLEAEGCVEPGSTVEEISAFMERQVKAGEGIEIHHAMRCWADSQPMPAALERKAAASRGKTTTKPSSKRKS
ncbi:MAG: hypothetical protein IT440_00240 [Phycisphaeraceae bacterium]|nr:hypothetical protein [Phycisphaeraceae bacterium]